MMNDTSQLTPFDALYFSASYLQLLKVVCDVNGDDFGELLRSEFGLDESVIEEPDAKIDGSNMELLLTKLQSFIRISQENQRYLINSFPLSMHGYLGLAAMTSATVREAIEIVIRFFSQVMPVFHLSTQQSDDRISITLIPVTDLGEQIELLAETALYSFCSLGKFTHLEHSCICIEFTHEQLNLTILPELFPGIEINTKCRDYRYSISISAVDSEIITGNITTQKMLSAILEEKQQEIDHSQPLTITVRKIIYARLEKSMTSSLETVCEEIYLSKRTLSRRLHEEGNNFKNIYNACRVQHARKLLLEPKNTISTIADALHFSTEASFSRFIKQQTGRSPSELRKRRNK
ncbi:helix-turn-helix transcriptional regulator [Veronia pacifica]|uniref:HTH araC/xylS-type domain-containing protein n=1 Tax=Veronia pacifica TaxID=1080227 RepID=A0A1C3E9E8_9GAMM|nr:AraC family transcriptional regulator [Veronia pacifica]ODA29898.1 hypothetical protein A8L45_21305 [Veronia pacifica]